MKTVKFSVLGSLLNIRHGYRLAWVTHTIIKVFATKPLRLCFASIAMDYKLNPFNADLENTESMQIKF